MIIADFSYRREPSAPPAADYKSTLLSLSLERHLYFIIAMIAASHRLSLAGTSLPHILSIAAFAASRLHSRYVTAISDVRHTAELSSFTVRCTRHCHLASRQGPRASLLKAAAAPPHHEFQCSAPERRRAMLTISPPQRGVHRQRSASNYHADMPFPSLRATRGRPMSYASSARARYRCAAALRRG